MRWFNLPTRRYEAISARSFRSNRSFDRENTGPYRHLARGFLTRHWMWVSISLLVIGLLLVNLAYLLDGSGTLLSRWNVQTKWSDAQHANTDWSQYAYTQYVTDTDYLCNSVMLFERLHTLGSQADRVLMYPTSMNLEDRSSRDVQLLHKARNLYDVKLQPISVVHKDGGDRTWADSYTKLLAFNQTKYARVLNLDSDSTVLQHMDELFLLPSAPAAMPRAYWLYPEKRPFLSSQLMLVEPSDLEFARIQAAIKSAPPGDFDMEIINLLYEDSCIVLPHRRYDLLTGEFRSKDHVRYLGNEIETWDAEVALREAKFLHFSDWPVPKPWVKASPAVIQDNQPKCVNTAEGLSCLERDMWLGFYTDFQMRRKAVCGT